jgi:hypothetical protein
LREIQVTSFPALSKQSRKKGSLHSICEAAEMLGIPMTLAEMLEMPMTLAYILMESAEDPTFFKNPSIPWAGHTKHCTPERVSFGVLDQYESTLGRPIHTHNKDNHFGRVSSVCVLSRDHWSPVLLMLYGSPLASWLLGHMSGVLPHTLARDHFFPRFYTFDFFFLGKKK